MNPGQGKKYILVVEDEGEILEIITEFLQMEFPGALILGAQNGRAGLEIATKKPCIELIITDFNMPEMDGGEMLLLMDRIPALRKVTRFIISGTIRPDEMVPPLNIGRFDDWIQKPFEPKELIFKIRAATRW